MATTPAMKQSETDHDQDPAKTPATAEAAKSGSGVTQVQTLLAHGKPSPAQIVKVLDAHRAEHDAIFALLQKTYGNTYVQQVVAQMNHLRASVKNKEVVAGDPASKDGGFFDASADAKGASWRSSGGDFTGKADKDGLDATYKLDADDSLHGTIEHEKADADAQATGPTDLLDPQTSATRGALDWQHGGKSEGQVFADVHDGKNYAAGASRGFDVGNGSLTAGLERNTVEGVATDGAFGSYRSTDKKIAADANVGVSGGGLGGGISGAYAPNKNDTYGASYRHDASGDTGVASASHKFDGGGSVAGSGTIHRDQAGDVTGTLAGAYSRDGLDVDANAQRTADTTSFHLGASDQITPNLTTAGTYDYSKKDGASSQSTLALSERYRSGNVVQGLDLNAGAGTRDYLGVQGSVEGKLANNLYGGAYGGFNVESGHQTTANIGASLTFTPSEKTALTLAGIVDQNGTLETRLQLDIFKGKISSIGELSDQKKNAMVSLFVSYTQQGTGGNHMLDQRFGASDYNTSGPAGSGAVTAGIRIKF